MDHYAIVAIYQPRNLGFNGLPIMTAMAQRGAVLWCGLMIVDLRNGDVVHWLRLEGDVMGLFDVALIPQVHCPRALGAWSLELDD